MMLEQQRTANSRASKCFTSAQAPLLAQAWADAIALLETGLKRWKQPARKPTLRCSPACPQR